ncbi:MAG: hypothetical protein ACOYM3_03405 [Terrimicrobiaceae bacterium]
MNLAIHDVETLLALHRDGCTANWAARNIVAWVPPAMVRARRCLIPLIEGGLVRQFDIAAQDSGFFEIFRQRLRPGLARAEDALLFLAERSGSILLAGEHAVTEAAGEVGLRVWSGRNDLLDSLFPLPQSPAPAPEIREPAPHRRGFIWLSTEFPSARQVPARDESTRQARTKIRSLNGSMLKVRRAQHKN